MIVYRILKVNRGIVSQNIVRSGRSSRLTRVVRILIESGLIYTASVVVLICTFLASNNAQYGVSDVVSWTKCILDTDADTPLTRR